VDVVLERDDTDDREAIDIALIEMARDNIPASRVASKNAGSNAKFCCDKTIC